MFSLIRDARYLESAFASRESSSLQILELKLSDHYMQTCDPQIHIRLSEINMIVAGTVIAQKEI